MLETFCQYKDRILGYAAGQDPVRIQRTTTAKIAKLLKGVPRAKLMRRPAPGKWSVAEILAHLAEDELVGAYRIRMILSSPGTPIQSFDQDKWAEAGSYAKRPPDKSLELFHAVREANLALLKWLKPEQWKLHGVHSERGVETIDVIVKLFAGHDINHLRQIEAIVEKARSGKQRVAKGVKKPLARRAKAR